MAVKLNAEQAGRALNIHKLLNVEIATRKSDGAQMLKRVIRRHSNYDFLGYVTLRLVGVGPMAGFNFFQKFEAKILKHGFYLDIPQEKGANGSGWFSDSCFGSAETRAVITRKCEELPEVQAWIAETLAQAKPGASAATTEVAGDDSNPYEG